VLISASFIVGSLLAGLPLPSMGAAVEREEVALRKRSKVRAVSAPAVPPAAMSQKLPEKPNAEARLLAAHNNERVRLGLNPLKWSPELAENARKWAVHLAGTNTFEHAVPGKGEADQGENLWMGTRASYDPEEMVQAWIDERTLFRPGKFPQVSTTGDWRDVGHYTQLIWHRTSHVGCAISANRSDEFLVCRYDPPGNWEGQHPQGR
jgi:hypothetical protein